MQAQSKQFRKRNAILSCLRQTCCHPSAEMIHDLLRTDHPDISLATVYRNLNWFRSQGLIQSLGAIQGIERFDACIEPHAHFICTACGAVEDLPQVELPYAQAKEAEKCAGFHIEGCQLVYTGLCGSCQQRDYRESGLQNEYQN